MIAAWRRHRAQTRRMRAIRRALAHHADQLGDPVYGNALAVAASRKRRP